MEVLVDERLLDFFKHGDVVTLERPNGIRHSDVWFCINDFPLVLATIVISLMNSMKLTDRTDMDMPDVKGGMKVHEEHKDDEFA